MSEVLISISGGRTSAYMAIWMIGNRQAVADYLGCAEPELNYHFVFANTGFEHDDTLRFMNDVNRYALNSEVVWVESEAVHGERESSKFRIVDYSTAYRWHQWEDKKHPFHDHIRKYGIPNVKFKSCTREMKLNAINSYAESIGMKRNKDFYTAIGIRDDENRRVSAAATKNKIIYPLIDLNPVCKDDVLEHMAQYEWDLRIPEHLGNCVTCYKKSFKKLGYVYAENPKYFEFNEAMERMYPRIGAEFRKYDDARDRKFFRGNRGTAELIGLVNMVDAVDSLPVEDGGCSESCEMYQTELIAE